jgi:hypothetical protein
MNEGNPSMIRLSENKTTQDKPEKQLLCNQELQNIKSCWKEEVYHNENWAW